MSHIYFSPAMNCIIIDDDKLSCKIFEGFVEKYMTLSLSGTFYSSIEARNYLMSHNDIDIVFLDIVMPELNGFDFLESLDSHISPNIIVVSSKDDYALKAYDFNVVDYLLKPVSYSRFCRAVDKVVRYYSKKDVQKTIESEIFVKTASTLVRLKYSDIIYIEALENYVCMNTSTDKYVIHFTMKALENQLPKASFVRIHRSFIVNRKLVQVVKDTSVDVLVGNSLRSIPIGKAYKDNLLDELNVMAK